MRPTDEILAERGQNYGDFGTGSRLEAAMIELIANNHMKQNNKAMSTEQIIWFSKIIMKLSRLSVTPNHLDSWIDIAGYARLVEIELNNKKEAENAQGQ